MSRCMNWCGESQGESVLLRLIIIRRSGVIVMRTEGLAVSSCAGSRLPSLECEILFFISEYCMTVSSTAFTARGMTRPAWFKQGLMATLAVALMGASLSAEARSVETAYGELDIEDRHGHRAARSEKNLNATQNSTDDRRTFTKIG